jgi:hypothetical protein
MRIRDFGLRHQIERACGTYVNQTTGQKWVFMYDGTYIYAGTTFDYFVPDAKRLKAIKRSRHDLMGVTREYLDLQDDVHTWSFYAMPQWFNIDLSTLIPPEVENAALHDWLRV